MILILIMAEDELKGLSPREKIKKLKELEEKKKKEIDDAQKQIRESEKELSAEEEWTRKVPIPQVAREDFSGSTQEEREILEAHRGLGTRKIVAEEEKSKKNSVDDFVSEDKRRQDLEFLAAEKTGIPPQLFNTDYAKHLSRQPVEELSKNLGDIYKRVEEKGYMNAEDQRKVQYTLAGAELKEKAGESGRYKSFSEEVAAGTSLIKQMGGGLLHRHYHGHQNENYQG